MESRCHFRRHHNTEGGDNRMNVTGIFSSRFQYKILADNDPIEVSECKIAFDMEDDISTHTDFAIARSNMYVSVKRRVSRICCCFSIGTAIS